MGWIPWQVKMARRVVHSDTIQRVRTNIQIPVQRLKTVQPGVKGLVREMCRKQNKAREKSKALRNYITRDTTACVRWEWRDETRRDNDGDRLPVSWYAPVIWMSARPLPIGVQFPASWLVEVDESNGEKRF
ncbi:hypothetical protein MGYG_01357 [Nannizzia gypsea CBS 118893]|uniref:Uncharacterized protein n=1 Tax=Arthroderma gypseum (strain ATCC MYA-4604 / CBS 118893) TaxID=535722 RepID=E5R0C8_ARTGP|nr:hypothetical protein MGYG_01357 [Nannizzia gypsea CBS 118893]EFQ98324.1 hypothetical protein MGYG_01357 [Nannizzia gypsea CBS 118893]